MVSFLSNKKMWYAITIATGKEQQVETELKQQLSSFGYWGVDKQVDDIKIFKKQIEDIKIYSKTDSDLPTIFKRYKNSHWEAYVGNDWVDIINEKGEETIENIMSKATKFRKITTKIVNKYSPYIYIHACLDNELIKFIKKIYGVFGFAGHTSKKSGTTPIVTNDIEFQRMLNSEKTTNIKTNISRNRFNVGEKIKIISGPYANSDGIIKEINNTQENAIVEVEIGLHKQKIQLSFAELEKIQ